MSTLQTTSTLSTEDLREEVRKEYANVALDPIKAIIFIPDVRPPTASAMIQPFMPTCLKIISLLLPGRAILLC